MLEVEAKVWVERYEPIKEQLERYFGQGQLLVKIDSYYAHPSEVDLRLRRVYTPKEVSPDCFDPNNLHNLPQGSAILTAKQKHITQGVECNKEVEITVDSFTQADTLIQLLGYTEYITKQKMGFRWEADSLVYELVSIPSLGWFLEIESVLDEPESKHQSLASRETAKLQVLQAFQQLGFSEDQFESRYYTDMLQEANR